MTAAKFAIVIAIVILLPFLFAFGFLGYVERERERETKTVITRRKLSEKSRALTSYHSTFGHFPTTKPTADAEPERSWRIDLLPFFESEE